MRKTIVLAFGGLMILLAARATLPAVSTRRSGVPIQNRRSMSRYSTLINEVSWKRKMRRKGKKRIFMI